MHQYKTIVQTLLVLSTLNFVFAAPAVPREARDTGNDVVVVAEDVTAVSERRRGTPPGGTTPSALSQGSVPSSDSSATGEPVPYPITETGRETVSAHPLSGVDAPAPAPGTILEASTTDTGRPVPVSVHDSTAPEGSTTPHSSYTPVTLDMLGQEPQPPSRFKKHLTMKNLKKVGGPTLVAGVIAATLFWAWLNRTNDD